MVADETTKLKAEIRRLRSLLAKSGRERQRLVDAACAKLTDLAEQIEWTGETESLELAETARDEFMVALYPPRLAELRAEEMACG